LLNEHFEVKIADFGLSKNLERELMSSLPELTKSALSVQRLTGSTYEIGTPMYRAPEALNRGVVDPRCDIYSLGLIYFEILNCFSTLHEKHIIFSQMAREKRLPDDFVTSFSQEAELIAMMVQELPDNRPTSSDIFKLRTYQKLERLYKVSHD